MSLANPPWLFDDPISFPPTQKSSNETQMQAGLPSVAYDSGLLNSAQSFASNAQWNDAEQIQGALPLTLNRIFGNENQSQEHGLM